MLKKLTLILIALCENCMNNLILHCIIVQLSMWSTVWWKS